MSSGFIKRSEQEVTEIAKRYGEKLQDVFDRVEIRLYGSYFKNSETDQSDLDFAVISRDFDGLDSYIALKILNRMKIGIDSIIEPIALSPKEFSEPLVGSIAYEIALNSRELFKADY